MYMYHVFIHSLIHGHLRCFYVLFVVTHHCNFELLTFLCFSFFICKVKIIKIHSIVVRIMEASLCYNLFIRTGGIKSTKIFFSVFIIFISIFTLYISVLLCVTYYLFLAIIMVICLYFRT